MKRPQQLRENVERAVALSEDQHVANLMFIANRYLESRVMTAISNAGHTDLTLAAARIMARVQQDGTRLTDLAVAAQVTKQTASVAVDKLVAQGYLDRAPDPQDARAKLIVLSHRALKVLVIARDTEQRVTQEWTELLGEDRMRDLRETLSLLRLATDPFMDYDDAAS